MSVWQQVASILSVTQGHFDTVPANKVKDAQAATLTRLWADHKKDMDVLDRGAKPSEETLKLIEKVATAAAKGFEE
jgi:F0F1-type ATP synthase alpha subunit